MGNSRIGSVRKTKAKPKKKSRFKFFFTLTIIIFGIVLLLLSPIFDVGKIDILGNSKVSVATIKQVAGLDTTVNIFSVNSSKVIAKLEEIPYIKSAYISKTYPNSLSIEIAERKVCGYINYKEMDIYILIDEEGMVLETKTYVEQKLPIIVGLTFEGFSVGEILKTENQNSFESVVILSKLFEKYGLEDVGKMDVSDIEDIHLYIDNIDILFGGMTEVDKKLQDLRGILDSDKIPKGARSILDMHDTSKYVFKFLR